jgi:hexokinase
MNVTWVLGWPDGHEKGKFLTIDLGGTNLRVCWIGLEGGKGETNITQEKYELPQDLKTGEADALWDFIAESLHNFIQDNNLDATSDHPLQLGFTFSYPVHQDYIDHGVLQTWTKGFDIQGVEGHDAAEQLRAAMAKRVRPTRTTNHTTVKLILKNRNSPSTSSLSSTTPQAP